jgi:hypothetical protein
MHFLIDASLPRSAGTVLRQLGHEATDVRDAGMGDVPDDIIAAYARNNHLVLVAAISILPISTSGFLLPYAESLSLERQNANSRNP